MPGCGNGHFAGILLEGGFAVVGVDPSDTGVAIAKNANPLARFHCLDLTQGTGDLVSESFDAITCIEVLEHVYNPKALLINLHSLLRPNGKLILTTPYHGYLKNLFVVASGRFDQHFNPLWEHGHIKFFSKQTLKRALIGTGFRRIRIEGIGRAPFLWKTMLAVASKVTKESALN